MSPFQLRRERFSEFCLLVKRLKKSNEKKQNPKEKPKQKFIPVTDFKDPLKRR